MKKTFEENLNELEMIVKELESGNVNLDDAIKKYSDAMKLAKECSDKINESEKLVAKIVKENGLTLQFCSNYPSKMSRFDAMYIFLTNYNTI